MYCTPLLKKALAVADLYGLKIIKPVRKKELSRENALEYLTYHSIVELVNGVLSEYKTEYNFVRQSEEMSLTNWEKDIPNSLKRQRERIQLLEKSLKLLGGTHPIIPGIKGCMDGCEKMYKELEVILSKVSVGAS